MATTTVDLTEQDARLVGELVNSGRVKDAGDAVHRGLQLLEKREARDAMHEWLCDAVQLGLDSVEREESVVLRTDEEITEFFAQRGSRV